MMKRNFIFAILTGAALWAWAIAQPDKGGTPGRDSVIISTVLIDEPADSILVDVYVTTGDSIVAIDIPLGLDEARISNDAPGWSFTEPLGRKRITGFGTPIFTDGRRQRLCSIKFQTPTGQRSGLITIRRGNEKVKFYTSADTNGYLAAFKRGYVVLHYAADERRFQDIQQILVIRDHSLSATDSRAHGRGLVLYLDRPQRVHVNFFQDQHISAGCFEDSLEAGLHYLIIYGDEIHRDEPEAKRMYCCINMCAILNGDNIEIRPIMNIGKDDEP